MEKKYTEIIFSAGSTIESAIKKLKDSSGFTYGKFNGVELYSDIDNLESAYKKITGMSKSDFDNKLKEDNDSYEEEKRKHEESIPEQTKEWIKKGGEVLDEKYLELWNRIVPIRLSDIYRGYELGACLEIIKELNSGTKLESSKQIIDKQGHSGMSFRLVCSMVNSLSDRGLEFVSYIKNIDKIKQTIQ